MDKIAKRTVFFLYKKKIVSLSEVPIVMYGLLQFISTISGFIVAILLGASMGILLEGILFLCVFIPLRIFAGGYHAKTRGRCATISFLILFVTFVLMLKVSFNELFSAFLVISEYIYIFLFTPITAAKHNLELVEHEMYRKKSRYILNAELVVFVVFFIFEIWYYQIFIYAWGVQVLLMIIEQIKK